MDVPRPHAAKQKRRKRIIYIAVSVLGLIVVTSLSAVETSGPEH